MPDEADKVKAKILQRRKPATPIPSRDFVSIGSTLLNLGCTGKPKCGLAKGTVNLWVGDSGSGKTWVLLNTLAEACINPAFKDYDLEFDNAENGALMDFTFFFGPLFVKRVKIWKSRTLEEMYDRTDDMVRSGRPFIRCVDSLDALVPRAAFKQLNKNRKQRETGEKESGSYGTEKARINSDRLRMVNNGVERTGSIFVMVCQTRQRIGFGAQFNPKTRSGGEAPTFYAANEFWTSIVRHIHTTVNGKPVEQGIVFRAKIKKNRVNGRARTVDVPILHSHGIDETGSLVDWLVEWGHWETTGKRERNGEIKGTITAPEFEVELKREPLIAHIEREGLLAELQALVAQVWTDIESKAAVERKPRYA